MKFEAMIVAMLVVVFASVAVAATRMKTTNVPTSLVLTMRNGANKPVTRTYDVQSFNYTANTVRATIDNPTLYRCGFEP